MIQRLSVPSLLSFWDERVLDLWFDAEKPDDSSALMIDNLNPRRDLALSDTVMVWSAADPGAISNSPDIC